MAAAPSDMVTEPEAEEKELLYVWVLDADTRVDELPAFEDLPDTWQCKYCSAPKITFGCDFHDKFSTYRDISGEAWRCRRCGNWYEGFMKLSVAASADRKKIRTFPVDENFTKILQDVQDHIDKACFFTAINPPVHYGVKLMYPNWSTQIKDSCKLFIDDQWNDVYLVRATFTEEHPANLLSGTELQYITQSGKHVANSGLAFSNVIWREEFIQEFARLILLFMNDPVNLSIAPFIHASRNEKSPCYQFQDQFKSTGVYVKNLPMDKLMYASGVEYAQCWAEQNNGRRFVHIRSDTGLDETMFSVCGRAQFLSMEMLAQLLLNRLIHQSRGRRLPFNEGRATENEGKIMDNQSWWLIKDHPHTLTSFTALGTIIHFVYATRPDPRTWLCPKCKASKSAYIRVQSSYGSTIYQCRNCKHVYDAAKDGKGKPFDDLPLPVPIQEIYIIMKLSNGGGGDD